MAILPKMINMLRIPEARALNRNFGLDIIRASSIVMVMLSHGMMLNMRSWESALAFYWAGFIGVELFFVISGYLIGSILHRVFIESPDASNARSRLKYFWIRRWFRTLPNYYLVLLVGFIMHLSSQAQNIEIWKYPFFLQNLAWPMQGFMVETWSLSIEEWFYLSFPIVLVMFIRIFGQRSETFFLTTIVYLIVFGLLREFSAFFWPFTHWDHHLRKIVLLRLDGIAYGAAIMVIMKLWPGVTRKWQHYMFLVGLIGLGLSFGLLDRILFEGVAPSMAANHFALTSASIALLLPFTIYQTENYAVHPLRTIITTISILSYSLYVVHLSIVILILQRWFGHWNWAIRYLAFWIISFSLAWLIYALYERRMTALRERFTDSRGGKSGFS